MSIEVALFGTLGRNAESKVSKSGKPYLRLNVRVGDGDSLQWVNAMVFDEQAVTAVDKLVKGAHVYIEGSIKLDEWTAQDGTKRSGLSVLSWHCRLAEIGRNKSKRDTTTDSVTSAAPPSTEPRDRDQQVRGIADPDFDDSVPF